MIITDGVKLSCDAFSVTIAVVEDYDVVEDGDDDNCCTVVADVVVAAFVVMAVMI
jgi:hypothetical protein